MATNSKEAARIRKQNSQLQQVKQKRNLAVQLLQSGESIRATATLTTLSRGTVGRLRQSIDKAKREGRTYDDNQHKFARGRKPILSDEEELVIIKKLQQVAARNFRITNDTVRSAVAGIVNDGRKGFANGVPSDKWIRMFRVRHPDLASNRFRLDVEPNPSTEN